MNDVLNRMGKMGLIPIVVTDDAELTVPAAKALIDGGLEIMEITMRTEQGLPAIKKVKEAYPEMLVGAGTVLSVEKAKEAVEAGAEFIVAPGFNPKLVEWCINNRMTITPGCVTPTEIERALSYGINVLKFFPVNIYGGINACKALHEPYRMVKFIPTGGVNNQNLADFADKTYIHAVGGGWLLKPAEINAQNFTVITKTVKEAINTLLGFEIAHVGINAENGKESLLLAKKFAESFGFGLKERNSSNFAGAGIEINKNKGLGAMGHIAVKTNNLDRAVFYLEKKGYPVDWGTRKGSAQKTVSVYLKEEMAGFAVHLLQK